MAAQYLALDSFWVDRSNYAEAEQKFYERLGHETLTPLVAEFVKARETIKEMKRQANEAADAFADGSVKETKNDNQGKKKQKQKAQKEQPKTVPIAEKNVEQPEISNTSPPSVLPPKIENSRTLQIKETAGKECSAIQGQQSAITNVASTASQAELNMGCNITAMDCEPVKFLEKKMLAFTDVLAKVQSQLEAMDARLSSIEQRVGCSIPYLAVCPPKPASPTCDKPSADDDDDVDLFGSESEDDEAAAKIKEERLAAYNAKKSKKPVLIAKSSIILDVKPWDDETDMKAMEVEVRKIQMDGLLWGASKLVPLAYGIKKLQITCVVEDDKVSIDWLQEQIEANEDFVQSVDIAAFNKI